MLSYEVMDTVFIICETSINVKAWICRVPKFLLADILHPENSLTEPTSNILVKIVYPSWQTL